MSYLGDTLTIGLILILLFGSIALYLYTRVQQTEQKVGLLESIVLDLKLTGEIQSFAEPVSAPSSPVAPPVSLSPSAPLTPVSSLIPSASLTDSLTDSLTPIYTPFQDRGEQEQEEREREQEQEQEVSGVPAEVSDIEFLPLDSVSQESIMTHSVSSYDSLSLKELQAQVRSRGLSVERGAKKQALIELLRQNDADEAKQEQMISLTPLESTSLDNE
jgi:hypothetical protein